jgi:hypothetical protein
VGPADFGRYHCEGDGGEISRDIVIGAALSAADLPTAGIRLDQNYPNPFNPSTEIAFRIDREQYVRLAVYDAAGRQVALLVDEVVSAGEHRTLWQAEGLPSGVYFYWLRTDGGNLAGKAMLVK